MMHLWMVGRLNIRPLIERNRVSSNAQTGLGGLFAHYDIGLVRLSFTGTAKICHAEPHRNAYVFIWLGAGPLTTTLKPSLLRGRIP